MSEILITALLVIVLVLQLRQQKQLTLTRQQLEQTQAQLEQKVESQATNTFHQIEAYLSLRDRLDLRQGLPYTPFWSAGPDFLRLTVEHALETKPDVIVECSSGLTTLMLARCCQLNGQGRVTSLENGEEYAEKTRKHLQRYELENMAEVIHAPLEKVDVNGSEYRWYSLQAIPDRSIDMLVIDGPPGFIQKHSRYPALPLLFDKLADGCTIFMDDAVRDDEKEIVAMWQAAYPGISHEYIKTERGCSVLSFSREVKPS